MKGWALVAFLWVVALLIAVMLLGALPVYAQAAARSYAGQGSIAMLEHLLSSWRAKVFVLVLLGFAVTETAIPHLVISRLQESQTARTRSRRAAHFSGESSEYAVHLRPQTGLAR